MSVSDGYNQDGSQKWDDGDPRYGLGGPTRKRPTDQDPPTWAKVMIIALMLAVLLPILIIIVRYLWGLALS